MDTLLAIVIPLALLGALYVVLPVAADTYRRFRRPRTVICPENGAPADIQIDAELAAARAATAQRELRVTRCSRWPGVHYCGQECVNQIR